MSEEEQLTQLCARLGAGPDQARAMAAQLLKRAGQIVTERGGTREEALAYLLQLVVKGRNGETPPGFEETKPPQG